MKKPWSGRFSGKTSASLEAFGESVSFDWRLWPYDIMGSKVHARMLARQGIIAQKDSKAIVRGLDAIAKEIEHGEFVFDPSLEDVHMNIEAALTSRIGPAGARLHTARSRNDQVALDIRLYLRSEIDSIVGLILGLERALVTQAGRNIEAVMPGYTHLQRAQPVLLAHHLLAYVEMLERDRERMGECRRRVNVMPLGAGALAGTSLPIDRRWVAKELGFDAVAANSIDAVSDRDFALEFAASAAILMTHLSRMSEELVLWATEEFGYVEIPDAYATGSSIMPQKKNPDIPELVRGKTGRVTGALMGLLTLVKGLPLAYNRDLQEDKPLLFDAADTARACLGILAELWPNLTFRTDRMRAAAGGGFSTATDLAEYLVGRGMPFREAHEVTGRAVAHCIEAGKALTELSLKELKGFSPMIEKDVFGRLGVDDSVRARMTEGGTAPRRVRREVARHMARLNSTRLNSK